MADRGDSTGTSGNLPLCRGTLFFKPIIPSDVYNITMNLKGSNAQDTYDLSSDILKKSIQFICSPLAHIFNNILSKGIFPNTLKMAKIIPIHKKGKRDAPTNYRPIAILPVLSKIIEKNIAQQLLGFLASHSLITKEQHGFLKNRSTATAIFEFLNTVLEKLERGEEVLGMFFDLSRAFDTVSHNIILQKLERYGVRGVALDLFRSYLTGRKQSVVVGRDGECFQSDWKNLGEFSVPQGSILGPLLYILYVNDLPQAVDDGIKTVLYADDTSVVISHVKRQNLTKIANTVATKVGDWLDKNGLNLNANKTAILNFKRTASNSGMSVRVGDSSVVPSGAVRFLGLDLDPQLKWSNHLTALTNRLSSETFRLRTLAAVCSGSVLLSVYHGCFHSVMSYGIEFWGSAGTVSDVLIVQKRAVRVIAGCGWRDHCRPLFKKLHIMTCVNTYIYI